MSISKDELTEEVKDMSKFNKGADRRIVEKRDNRGALDKIIEKITSRKLLVWGFATYLLIAKALTSEHWVWVSLIYLGSQGAVDFVAVLKNAGK